MPQPEKGGKARFGTAALCPHAAAICAECRCKASSRLRIMIVLSFRQSHECRLTVSWEAGVAEYAMKVEKGITVTMRDGIKISLCVYRPDAPGPFPTLFAASPYQYEMDEVPAYPLFLWRETGPVEWYVGQGYAYVHADVRGSGRSEGEFSFMGLDEQQDYLELIAWIVKQPWS